MYVSIYSSSSYKKRIPTAPRTKALFVVVVVVVVVFPAFALLLLLLLKVLFAKSSSNHSEPINHNESSTSWFTLSHANSSGRSHVLSDVFCSRKTAFCVPRTTLLSSPRAIPTSPSRRPFASTSSRSPRRSKARFSGPSKSPNNI